MNNTTKEDVILIPACDLIKYRQRAQEDDASVITKISEVPLSKPEFTGSDADVAVADAIWESFVNMTADILAVQDEQLKIDIVKNMLDTLTDMTFDVDAEAAKIRKFAEEEQKQRDATASINWARRVAGL